MKTRTNLPALITLGTFALERAHYLFLEELFQIRLGAWAPVRYEAATQSYDRLMGLGLVTIGRHGFEITEKADRLFNLQHAETGRSHVEPRDAAETVLIPESPVWTGQIPAMFMFDQDVSEEIQTVITEARRGELREFWGSL